GTEHSSLRRRLPRGNSDRLPPQAEPVRDSEGLSHGVVWGDQSRVQGARQDSSSRSGTLRRRRRRSRVHGDSRRLREALDPAVRALYDLSLGRRRMPVGSSGGYYPTRRWETDQCW
ncbi:unnamed protein product, partial [Linum tenue]